jgi:hypothetical protein
MSESLVQDFIQQLETQLSSFNHAFIDLIPAATSQNGQINEDLTDQMVEALLTEGLAYLTNV